MTRHDMDRDPYQEAIAYVLYAYASEAARWIALVGGVVMALWLGSGIVRAVWRAAVESL